MPELDAATRAIIKLFVLPPGLLIGMMLLGWLLGRSMLGRGLVLLGIVLLYALSTPAVLDRLAASLETVPAPGIAALRTSGAEGILVFLAGTRERNPELGGTDTLDPLSLARMDQALKLRRETGLPIIVSGGTPRSGKTAPARLAADWLQQRAGIQALAIDTTSRDTWENARNSAALIDRKGLRRVILVTHAGHMPRAHLSSRAAGIDTVPAPFGFEHTPEALRQPGIWTDWLPAPGVLGRSYRVLHEMAGLVWYGLSRL